MVGDLRFLGEGEILLSRGHSSVNVSLPSMPTSVPYTSISDRSLSGLCRNSALFVRRALGLRDLSADPVFVGVKRVLRGLEDVRDRRGFLLGEDGHERSSGEDGNILGFCCFLGERAIRCIMATW